MEVILSNELENSSSSMASGQSQIYTTIDEKEPIKDESHLESQATGSSADISSRLQAISFAGSKK